MKNSKEIDKLQDLWKKGKWVKFFKESLVNLENAKNNDDQSTIDITFRFMRGAVFFLGLEFGESERKEEMKNKEFNNVCSACGKKEDDGKLVGFANGHLCEECTNLISQAFN